MENINKQERRDDRILIMEKLFTYDIIFLDRPYMLNNGVETVELILEKGVLDEDGIIVVECARDYKMPESIGKMKLFRQKSYAHTNVYYYNSEE
jgi:16S rRNA (guanine966-N2)-methyltransferase